MDFYTWLLAVMFALITALTPGPGVLLAVSNAVGFGVRAAILCSLGNAMGLFVVSSATMIGLGAALRSSALLFTLLKFVGAAYLIYLGVRQWRSEANVFVQPDGIVRQEKSNNARLLFQGMLLAPTNPKSILFFAAVLPQFIHPKEPLLFQFFVLTMTFAMATVVSHIIYASLAHHSKHWFHTTGRVKIFNRFSGGVLMLLGASMFRLRSSPG